MESTAGLYTEWLRARFPGVPVADDDTSWRSRIKCGKLAHVSGLQYTSKRAWRRSNTAPRSFRSGFVRSRLRFGAKLTAGGSDVAAHWNAHRRRNARGLEDFLKGANARVGRAA